MGKLWGGRWQVMDERPLGSGGQSQVYKAIDKSGALPGEFALKRVINVARHDRFRNEVEAIKGLCHPNIIRLIDHSALSAGPEAPEKQFLVMPLAAGGDLSQPNRLSFYKGAIEATLQVAMQIAQGLAAAHKADIIHRDIKPQNILFTGNGHELVIADFGICLIRTQARVTPADEVVGPRAFMAPELEEGGRLDVSPSADIYSLGKVLYFTFSGGTILSREALDDPKHAAMFDASERAQLFRRLLRRMIVTNEYRLQTMDQVIEGLRQIEEWEQKARLLAISPTGLSAIDKLKRSVETTQRVAVEDRDNRAREERALAEVASSFRAWLEGELQLAVAHIGGDGLLECAVEGLSNSDTVRIQWGHNSLYVPVEGLVLRLKVPTTGREHILQLRLFRLRKHVVTITVQMPGQQNVQTPLATSPPEDLQLAFFPVYRGNGTSTRPGAPNLIGYLAQPDKIGINRSRQEAGPRGRPKISYDTLAPISLSYYADASIGLQFKASEWPGNLDATKETLAAAIDAFVSYIAAGANGISG